MTRFWRRYRLWAEKLKGSDPRHTVAEVLAWWLSGHGFIRAPDSGSGWWRDYEWQWRFWRGPYYEVALTQKMRLPRCGIVPFRESLLRTRDVWRALRRAYFKDGPAPRETPGGWPDRPPFLPPMPRWYP